MLTKDELNRFITLFDVYQGDVADRLHKTLNRPPGSYHLLALHGMLDLNRTLNLKRKQEVALIIQGDNLLDEILTRFSHHPPTRCRWRS